MQLTTIANGKIQLSLYPDDARSLTHALDLAAQAATDNHDHRLYASLAAMFTAAGIAGQLQADFGHEEPAAAD